MKKTNLLLRKLALLNILLLFLCGCAVSSRSVQKDNGQFDKQLALFEQAKGLSSSQIPPVYDASRLRVGSSVKIKFTQGGSGKPYFMSTVLRDIQVDGGGKSYVTDFTAGKNQIFTHKEKESALKTIVFPEDVDFEKMSETMDYKDLRNVNLPTAVVRGALVAGPLGIVLGVMDYQNEKEMHEEITKALKGQKIRTKVIDFNLISNENIQVANKTVACRVYQIKSLRCQTMPGSKRVPGFIVLMDETEKLWISDDVPFGIAKREGVQTIHMHADTNTRFRVNMPSSAQVSKYTSEVVEFSY